MSNLASPPHKQAMNFILPGLDEESLHLNNLSAYEFINNSSFQSMKNPLENPDFLENFNKLEKKPSSQKQQQQQQQYKIHNFSEEELQEAENNLQSLGSNLQNCEKLFSEESEIFSGILELGKNVDQADKLYDLFEALYTEVGMRKDEKDKVFKNINSLFQETQNIIKKQQGVILGLQQQVQQFEKFLDIRNLRQAGKWTQKHQKNYTKSIQDQIPEDEAEQNETLNQEMNEGIIDIYDWEVDIDLITNIGKNGWTVKISPGFLEDKKQADFFKVNKQQAVYGDSAGSNEDSRIENVRLITDQNEGIEQINNWTGATVAVVGLYDKGKTFVLNNLTGCSLPSGKKCTTKGVSFKNVNVDNGTNLILVDTAGSYSPVKIESELSIVEKEATENFLQELVFEISDYFICVVNDFTSLDQRYLDKISRMLQNSTTKTFREIIVIHNLKEVESQEILEHAWENQVTQIYKDGMIQQTKVASVDQNTGKLEEKSVIWFKTQYTRHVCIVNDDCKVGRLLNPWVFSLLKYWLKSVFVPVNRNFSVVKSLLSFSVQKLTSYFKTTLNLVLEDTEDKLVKKIIAEKTQKEQDIKIPQFTIDASGLANNRPDNFTPSVDIIANDKYYIYMDVPGLSKKDISIYRSNVISVVKGNKQKPYTELYRKLERNERKYGEFTLSFKIPEIYERKWKQYNVENGVLCIEYEKDNDEQFSQQMPLQVDNVKEQNFEE